MAVLQASTSIGAIWEVPTVNNTLGTWKKATGILHYLKNHSLLFKRRQRGERFPCKVTGVRLGWKPFWSHIFLKTCSIPAESCPSKSFLQGMELWFHSNLMRSLLSKCFERCLGNSKKSLAARSREKGKKKPKSLTLWEIREPKKHPTDSARFKGLLSTGIKTWLLNLMYNPQNKGLAASHQMHQFLLRSHRTDMLIMGAIINSVSAKQGMGMSLLSWKKSLQLEIPAFLSGRAEQWILLKSDIFQAITRAADLEATLWAWLEHK